MGIEWIFGVDMLWLKALKSDRKRLLLKITFDIFILVKKRGTSNQIANLFWGVCIMSRGTFTFYWSQIWLHLQNDRLHEIKQM